MLSALTSAIYGVTGAAAHDAPATTSAAGAAGARLPPPQGDGSRAGWRYRSAMAG